ncbi:MAG TPA: PqqD family peptide modification chaperone [Rhizomicrobium sp.]
MQNNPPLTAASFVVRSSNLVQATVNGEIVALHIEKGICYGLNQVGSRVWELASSPVSIEDICATITKEYDVTPQICRRDVLELLEGLRMEGLIDALPADKPLGV